MPQLNPADFSPQLIWLAICFIGLYLIMAKAALPRIGSVLEQRRDKMADDLEQAERLKSETEQAIAAYEKALGEARSRAHAIAEETRAQLKAESDKQRKSVEDELNVKTAEAEARINDTKVAAMKQVQGVAADTAQAIVKQLIGASLTKTKAKAAVTKAQGR